MYNIRNMNFFDIIIEYFSSDKKHKKLILVAFGFAMVIMMILVIFS